MRRGISNNEGAAATGNGKAATVEDGGEAKRGNIFSEPLIDEEDGLRARHLRPSGSYLHTIAEPSMVFPGPIGGEVEAANRRTDAGSATGEDVQVATLEVVVSFRFGTPCLQVRDPNRLVLGVVKDYADFGIGSSFDDRTSLHVQCVHALLVFDKWSQ